MSASSNRLAFCSELRASGHGEVWDHTDEKKFDQFGWRTTTSESAYKSSTLIGNWCEESFDDKRVTSPKPLPSQYNHYFTSTYGKSYGIAKPSGETAALQHREDTRPCAFPGHQPQFDLPALKAAYTGYRTTSSAAYTKPTK
ncbi:cilia- and flagella-associated protein 68-like [Oscarella lobularis]|uniref:cilia- and flagella-associated protein 68-like n=1 Tax=Oscarella lobularis TaxID=121494 RepID=UPI0033142F37